VASPSNASQDAVSIEGYPKRRSIVVTLDISLDSPEEESYLFTGDSLQAGFVADLFDILNHDNELNVQSINGLTQADIQKLLSIG
jgi:hypothetical protein